MIVSNCDLRPDLTWLFFNKNKSYLVYLFHLFISIDTSSIHRNLYDFDFQPTYQVSSNTTFR